MVSASDLRTRGASTISKVYGGKILDAEIGTWLEERLTCIHRARNLLKIAGAATEEATRGGPGVEIDVKLIQYKDETDRQGKVVRWDQAGIKFKVGDIIGFKLHNRSRFPVDVTLLHVDSDFGIQPIFPIRNTTGENRINFNETIRTPRAKVTGGNVGLEHVAVIAVKGDGPPVDFTCLAQPSLERARGVATRGGQEKRTLDSPLGQLFQTGFFGQGATRGLATNAFEEYALRLVSWQTAQAAKSPRKEE